MTALDGWGNFYMIVGSSTGALIGLQFVVMTLIAGLPTSRGDAHAGAAFTTPTVVHFGAVLLPSAVAGAAAPLLLYIGIHNAWDVVTYHVFVKRGEQGEADRRR